MNTFMCQKYPSLAVTGLTREPSANLPPSEPSILLYVRSAELDAGGPRAAGCEQMLDLELAALSLELRGLPAAVCHPLSFRDAGIDLRDRFFLPPSRMSPPPLGPDEIGK